ncbi:MAG: glycosyltransferase 61 family protein [Planctomycetia bacterium]
MLVPTPPPGCSGRVDSYYHFLFDLLLPLCRLLARVDPAARVAIPPVGPFTSRILDLFGERVAILEPDDAPADAPRLPLFGMNPQGVAIDRRWLSEFRRFVFDRYRIAEVERPNLVVLVERVPPDPYYRLRGQGILATSGATRRSLVNHAEVRSLLEGLTRPECRFRNVQLEHMDFAEQLETFARAALVIGQHGAGLANAVWMRPGSGIVELSSESPDNFLRLARLGGHRFARFETGEDHATVNVERLATWLRREPTVREILA